MAESTGNNWLLKDIGSGVVEVLFSPDGHILASVGINQVMRLSDAATGRDQLTVGGLGLAFSPNGQLMASIDRDGGVRLWRTENSTELRKFEGPAQRRVAFNSDSRFLAGLSDKSLKDKVLIWNVEKEKPVIRMRTKNYAVHQLAFSPDNVVLVGASTEIILWDTETGGVLQRFEEHTDEIQSVVFSPDGDLLASGSRDGTVRLWDFESKTQAKIMTGHLGEVHSVAFSPDGQLLASGSWDTTVRLWDVESGEMVNEFKGHGGYVNTVAFSPDGRLLASGSWDNSIRLWRINMPDTEWQAFEQQWRQEQSPQWEKAGRCPECGQKVAVWDRWRGKKLCKEHR